MCDATSGRQCRRCVEGLRRLKVYADYKTATSAAIDWVRGEGDPYARQQVAAGFTSGKDRPVCGILDDLSFRIAQQTADDVARRQSDVRLLVPIVSGVLGLSILLGLTVALVRARKVASSVGMVARAATGSATGDLDQDVNIRSEDELGQMAAAFRRMIAYHQRMAAVADAVAGGDLNTDVVPKSGRDRLGIALRGMVGNLRALVASEALFDSGGTCVD